jgi:hypothetical protein
MPNPFHFSGAPLLVAALLSTLVAIVLSRWRRAAG